MADVAARNEWTTIPTCRRCRAAYFLAPGIIGAGPDGKAIFRRQPQTDDEVLQTWRAAIACPTGSILPPDGLKAPDHVFPQLLAENAYLLGYNDNRTAGAHPFFIRSKSGQNFLIDGPAFRTRTRRILRATGRLGSHPLDASR